MMWRAEALALDIKIPTVDREGRSDSLWVLSYSIRILYRILQYIELQLKKRR